MSTASTTATQFGGPWHQAKQWTLDAIRYFPITPAQGAAELRRVSVELEWLDSAIADLVADTGEPAALAVLVAVGRDLLDLPREAFRESLAQQLERSTPMPGSPSYIPAGLSPVTPYLLVRDPAAAIQFYEDVFSATEVMRHDVGGQVVHAKISIGEAVVELGQHGQRTDADVGDLPPIGMHLFVEDVDAVHASAIAAGARSLSPIEDQYYGDREVSIADPFGIVWFVATHVHD